MRGERHHHGGHICGIVVLGFTVAPARTLIAVKLLTDCIRLTDDGNAFPMVVMAVAMTAAMAVAQRWRRAAFIVIGDIKGVKCYSGTLSSLESILSLQGFKVLFQHIISSTPTARKLCSFGRCHFFRPHALFLQPHAKTDQTE
jgi:hypothetical protein